MSAKKDSKVGLKAVIHSDRDRVVKACEKAAAVLDTRARVATGASKVTISILAGMILKLSSVSPVVGIYLAPGEDETIQLRAGVDSCRTTQPRYMMIPIAPKHMVGKREYMTLLASLEQELLGIDEDAQIEWIGRNK